MNWLTKRRLQSDKPEKRLAAVWKIIDGKQRSLANDLVPLLADPDVDVRRMVVLTLARWGNRKAVKMLLATPIASVVFEHHRCPIGGDIVTFHLQLREAEGNLRKELASLVCGLEDEDEVVSATISALASDCEETLRLATLSPLGDLLAKSQRVNEIFTAVKIMLIRKPNRYTATIPFLGTLLKGYSGNPDQSLCLYNFLTHKEEFARTLALSEIRRLNLTPPPTANPVALAIATNDYSQLKKMDGDKALNAALEAFSDAPELSGTLEALTSFLPQGSTLNLVAHLKRLLTGANHFVFSLLAEELGRRRCQDAKVPLLEYLKRTLNRIHSHNHVISALGHIGGDDAAIAIARHSISTDAFSEEMIHALMAIGSPESLLIVLSGGATQYSADKLFLPFLKRYASVFTKSQLMTVAALESFSYRVQSPVCGEKYYDEVFDPAPLRQLAKQELLRRGE